MSWDHDFAKRLHQVERKKGPTAALEGRVEKIQPLTVSLYGGEVMAPPAPLEVAVGAQGYQLIDHVLSLRPWSVGDRVACCWMGKTLIVLGKLGG